MHPTYLMSKGSDRLGSVGYVTHGAGPKEAACKRSADEGKEGITILMHFFGVGGPKVKPWTTDAHSWGWGLQKKHLVAMDHPQGARARTGPDLGWNRLPKLPKKKLPRMQKINLLNPKLPLPALFRHSGIFASFLAVVAFLKGTFSHKHVFFT